jgi:hypothetical protein
MDMRPRPRPPATTTSRTREWPLWALSYPLRTYVILAPVAAAIVLAISAAQTHWQLSQLTIFLPLLACGMLAIEATRNVAEPHGTPVRRCIRCSLPYR